jgi:hypothetical protein
MEEKKKPKNKGGRPTKPQKRETHLGFYVTVTEGTLIKAKAQRAGVKVADYLRDLAIKGKVRQSHTPEEVQHFKNLTGIANNLNQLTKEAHKQGMAFITPKILKALDELNKTLADDYKNQDR